MRPAEGAYLARALREQRISIRGARTHNLKNIDLDIPRNQLVVITGLLGSGKSSMAFDALYAEGQRRYAESLPAYARQCVAPLCHVVRDGPPAFALGHRRRSFVFKRLEF
ncbi:hypothetical protein GCM10027032_00570 [Simplicispira piscis]